MSHEIQVAIDCTNYPLGLTSHTSCQLFFLLNVTSTDSQALIENQNDL